MSETCEWCGHPKSQHHVEPAIDPEGPVVVGDRHACLRCHVCYPDREALATMLEEGWEAARRRHVDELRDRVADSPNLLAIVNALDNLERQERDRGTADVQRAIDRLRQVARDMEVNAEEAIRAGLQGDGRRWRTVRGAVVAALELLGAPMPRPTITVDITPADLAAKEVRVHEAQLEGHEDLAVGDTVWVHDGDATTVEGTVRGRTTDNPNVWRIRLWLGRHQQGTGR